VEYPGPWLYHAWMFSTYHSTYTCVFWGHSAATELIPQLAAACKRACRHASGKAGQREASCVICQKPTLYTYVDANLQYLQRPALANAVARRNGRYYGVQTLKGDVALFRSCMLVSLSISKEFGHREYCDIANDTFNYTLKL